jgi:uncharacterized protein (TIGR03067 family)
MARIAVILLSAAVLLQTEYDRKDDAKKPTLEGSWQVTRLTYEGGMPATERDIEGMIFQFKGNALVCSQGKRDYLRGTIKLDSTKNQMWLDVEVRGLGVLLGIFSFKGDTLEICQCNEFSSDKRPSELKASKNAALYVLKKAKQ